MIPRTLPSKQTWQQLLRTSITSATELCAYLGLPPTLQHDNNFALRVPRGFVDRMQRNNPQDPLLLQVLPQAQELTEYPGFSQDPLQEAQFNRIPGILHKYPNRILVTLTGHCAVNCRYCFRRHFPYAENTLGTKHWENIFNYLREHPEVNEVILSGGDPLILPDALLKEFAENIATISHIDTLRIHSRLPIVIPERICDEFIAWFSQSRLQPVLVTHCNHPQEINEAVSWHLQQLSCHGITALNQSVLLKHVNNDAKILAQLSKQLFAAKVLPYYLHRLDAVKGAGHFALPLEEIHTIYAQLQCLLPGYLLPKLVQEIPGKLHKTLI
ncbi:MAG: EF-P beta-lysylation protein EpmB [Legionellales bacterium]|nr:EF-P beta-lysylation protein EpmB [Legionellales bacterium]